MEKYLSKTIFQFLTLFTICLFTFSCGKSKDCWVCEGAGENNCVVCVNGQSEVTKAAEVGAEGRILFFSAEAGCGF